MRLQSIYFFIFIFFLIQKNRFKELNYVYLQLNTLKKNLICCFKTAFLCNRTRNEHFVSLKQAAKSNFAAVVRNDGP
jgi:hypothetical protein